jgi:hypothetical protein
MDRSVVLVVDILQIGQKQLAQIPYLLVHSTGSIGEQPSTYALQRALSSNASSFLRVILRKTNMANAIPGNTNHCFPASNPSAMITHTAAKAVPMATANQKCSMNLLILRIGRQGITLAQM